MTYGIVSSFLRKLERVNAVRKRTVNLVKGPQSGQTQRKFYETDSFIRQRMLCCCVRSITKLLDSKIES
jgi:hypothetical protein